MEGFMILVGIVGILATVIIGVIKHRAFEGIVAGLLLSWIGFIWLLIQKPKVKCSECGSWITKGVKRCKSCGELICSPH